MQATDAGQIFVHHIGEPKARALASEQDIDNTDQTNHAAAHPSPTQQGFLEARVLGGCYGKGNRPGEQRELADQFDPAFVEVAGP